MELGLARIHLCKRQGLRWPELTGTGPAAATGVRASTGTGYAWRASELRGWTGSWEIHELEVVLGREFGDLQRRRRQA